MLENILDTSEFQTSIILLREIYALIFTYDLKYDLWYIYILLITCNLTTCKLSEKFRFR